MNLMMTMVRKLRENEPDKESGAAMVMALLVTMILLTIVTSMTALAAVGLDKGRDIQNYTAASNAADSAISHALSLANSQQGQNGNGLKDHLGVANAVYGNVSANANNPDTGDGQFSWRWYAEQKVDSKANLVYEIYATGYRYSPDDFTSRTFKVVLDSLTIENALYESNGQAFYVPTLAGMFQWPVFGYASVELQGDSKIYEYDSSIIQSGYPTLSVNTQVGSVASNGMMDFSNDTLVENPMFLASDGELDPNRCTGSRCSSNSAGTQLDLAKQSYGMALNSATELVQDVCPLTSYPDWLASEHGGTIEYSATPKCYGNIIFDVDTSLPYSYSSGRPAMMMAKGNIIVEPGVEVNRQETTSQGPLALRIYSEAGTEFTMKRGTAADPTKMTAVIAGEQLTCNIGGNNSSLSIHGTALYGSVACNTVIVEEGSEIWWDNQIEQVTHEGSDTSKRLWSIASYQEV